MTIHLDDDAPLDPAAMLALAERQKRAVSLAHLAPAAWMFGIWGVSWLVGFMLLWLAHTTKLISLPVAAAIFGALIAASIIASTVIGIRMGRGIRGPSDFQGAVYGLSWALTGTAFNVVGMGLLQNGMPSELAALYFPSAYALMAGTMYLAGAALWSERGQLALGIVMLTVGAVSPYFGNPNNNLAMALGGGGAFLVAAAVYVVRIRAERRRQ